MKGSTNLPFTRRITSDAPSDLGSVGGDILPFTAAAALNIGDAVYISAADTVAKSNTPANYQKFAGIVVGGKATYNQVGTLSTDVGVAAAATGEIVLVQRSGKAWVVADAAIVAGALLTQGATTAGRVDDSASATQGQIIGLALQAATNAADKLQMLIGHR